MNGEGSLAVQLDQLETMDLTQLRAAWKRHVGSPTDMRSTDLMRRLLAWALQAEAEPWLVADLELAIKRARPARTRPLQPGLRLVREWQGVRHEAEVVADGVAYNGQTYASLSEVARVITRTRWNCPRFLGLRGHG